MTTERRRGAASRLSLAPIGGAPFSLDASLDTVGVVDGDLLALQPVPAGPAAPGIVEDIADAAVIFSASRRKPWGTAHIQRGALAAVIGAGPAGTGLAVAHRVATGALGRPVRGRARIAVAHRRSPRLLTAARSPRAGAGAVDRRAGADRRGVGAGGARRVRAGAGAAGRRRCHRVVADQPDLLAASASGRRVLHRRGGGRGRRAAGRRRRRRSGSCRLLTLGCGLIVVGAAGHRCRPRSCPRCGRASRCRSFPAPGDPTPSAPSLRVLEDLPRRVRVSDAHQTGFIAGAVLLACSGRWRSRCARRRSARWGWYVVAAHRGGGRAAGPGVGLGRVQGVAAGPAIPGGRRPAGALTATGRYVGGAGAALVLAALVVGRGLWSR